MGFSATYLLRYDLSFFIVMVRFGLYTTVPKVCYCVQFHVMAVYYLHFSTSSCTNTWIFALHTLYISRNCFSWREPAESPP